MVDQEKYIKWINEGIDAGYISNPFCYTHDGDPYMTEEENTQWEEGGDPCSPVVKLVYETGYWEELERALEINRNAGPCGLSSTYFVDADGESDG